MDNCTLTIALVKSILKELPDKFDSHEFIIALLKQHPACYGSYLVKHDNVATADGEIARFLSANSVSLEIEKIEDKLSSTYLSTNILGNNSPCARWRSCSNNSK